MFIIREIIAYECDSFLQFYFSRFFNGFGIFLASVVLFFFLLLVALFILILIFCRIVDDIIVHVNVNLNLLSNKIVSCAVNWKESILLKTNNVYVYCILFIHDKGQVYTSEHIYQKEEIQPKFVARYFCVLLQIQKKIWEIRYLCPSNYNWNYKLSTITKTSEVICDISLDLLNET